MSRCFPYPPPGYCKIGATTNDALIESIKLQKETDKKAKAERKRERREKKEKKQKDKDNRRDKKKLKSQNNPNEHKQDSQKVLQKAAKFTEDDSKNSELKTKLLDSELKAELLERSDLTEEHGQPSSSHKPSYSSDSTQNSNKRKRDNASLPEVPTGKPFKIRLLKKLKGPDSSNETDRPLVPFAPNCDNDTRVSQSRTDIPVTSGRGNNAVNVRETKSNDLNGLHLGRKQFAASSARLSASAPFSQLNHLTAVGSIQKTEVSVASRSRNSDKEVLHSSRKPILQSCGRPVPTRSQMNSEIPGASSIAAPAVFASRTIDAQELCPGSNKTKPSATGKRSIDGVQVPILTRNQMISEIPGASSIAAPAVFASRTIDVQGLCPGSNKTMPSATGKRSIDGIQMPVNSGSTKPEKKTEPIVEVTPKVAPTRHEKKLLKKQSKYEKLVGCWVPPVLETQLREDEEDWLSRRVETVKSCSRDGVEICRESTASSLWQQPCARLLVEADIYALPYTVPF